MCSKRYTFLTKESPNPKIVFTLLAKVIAFYLQMAIVKIKIPRYKKPINIISRFYWGLVPTLFDTNPYELSNKYIGGSLLRSKI